MALKFLIVDDSVTMRRIVANSLRTIGHDSFVEAENGRDAMTKLGADDSINFIITDWNMPDVSGLELVQTIRATAKFAALPILMVTTRGLKEDIIEALNAKVNNYIVKPFTPQILREKIEQIISTVG